MSMPNWKKIVFGLAFLGVVGALNHLGFHHTYFSRPPATPVPADSILHPLLIKKHAVPCKKQIIYEP